MGAGGQIMRELLFSRETNVSRHLGWGLQELPLPASLPGCVRGWVLVNLLSVGNGRIATLKQKRKNLLGRGAAFSLTACLLASLSDRDHVTLVEARWQQQLSGQLHSRIISNSSPERKGTCLPSRSPSKAPTTFLCLLMG